MIRLVIPTIFIASLLIVSDAKSQTILCPDDIVASINDKPYEVVVDDAIVDGWTTFDLDREQVDAVITDCSGPDSLYIVQTATRANQSIQCSTLVTYTIYNLTDLPTVEPQIEASNITLDELILSILTPELDIRTKTMVTAYSDKVIYMRDLDIRIVRDIIFLDWCDGDTKSETQIITGRDMIFGGGAGPFWIQTLAGNSIQHDSLIVGGTDVTAAMLEVCSLESGNTQSRLNCIQSLSEGDLTVQLIKTSGRRAAISTLDQVLVSRDILGLGALDRPGLKWAADINGTGTITGADIVEMRSLILAKAPNVDGQHFGLAAQNPDIEPELDGTVMLPASVFPLGSDFRLYAIKKGDIDGSYSD